MNYAQWNVQQASKPIGKAGGGVFGARERMYSPRIVNFNEPILQSVKK